MTGRIVLIGICGALALCAAPQSSGENTTLNGCVDEQPGPQYVLRGLTELKLIARLEPDGFAAESFAKYLGHKVSVKGRLMTGSEPAVMHVKTIETLSGVCAPPNNQADQASVTGKSEVKTLTGCVDEQAGRIYVLIGAVKREILAELEPAGFDRENFARFLGHSVSLRGEVFYGRNPPLMRIKDLRAIEERAGHCAPQ